MYLIGGLIQFLPVVLLQFKLLLHFCSHLSCMVYFKDTHLEYLSLRNRFFSYLYDQYKYMDGLLIIVVDWCHTSHKQHATFSFFLFFSLSEVYINCFASISNSWAQTEKNLGVGRGKKRMAENTWVGIAWEVLAEFKMLELGPETQLHKPAVRCVQ